MLLKIAGKANCPTPACGWPHDMSADIIDIGNKRFLICQRCASHRNVSGWSVREIQERYNCSD